MTNIKHHFFGLDCEIDRELMDRGALKQRLGAMNWNFVAINFLNQIHSSEVVVINSDAKILPEQNLPKADAIVCSLPNVAIAIVTADCAPIIFKDEKNDIVAVAHAGWRGAKGGVIENALKKMCEIGADLKQIKAFLGPLIHQKSYQISREFYDDFIADNADYAQFFVDDSSGKGKFLFDLPAFVKHKIKEAGIEKIEDVGIDTYEDYQSYASYRKACHDGRKTGGRNVSIAMIERRNNKRKLGIHASTGSDMTP